MKITSIIYITVSILISTSFNSYATSPITPSSNCKAGKVWHSGYALNAKGPSYLLVNTSGRFRGDTSTTILFENIDFYVDGDFYGDDRTDYAGDAYKNIPFNEKGTFTISMTYWPPLVHACSYTQVTVHDAPKILSTSLNGGSNINTSITTFVDPNSKNKGVRDITYTYRNLDYNSTQTFSHQSSSTSTSKVFHPQYNGSYRVSVNVSDGTFSKGGVLGEVDYTGGQNCRDCGNRN